MADEKSYYKFFQNVNLVGRLTKDPFFGHGMASFSVAINQSYKAADGTWKPAPVQFEDVSVFDDDGFQFVQDNLHKGSVVELFGQVQYRERIADRTGTGKIYRYVVVYSDNPQHYLKLATPIEKGNTKKDTPARSRQKVDASPDDNEAPF